MREYRIRAGLSQSELGAKAGVTYQPDSEIRERRREAVPQLSTFATKLAVAVDELPKGLRMVIDDLVRDLTGNEIREA